MDPRWITVCPVQSGMCECSRVSVKHNKLHSRNSLCVLIRAVSSSVLFARERPFPAMTEGTAGLCLLFSAFTFTPAPHPRRLVRSSFGTSCRAPGSSTGGLSANSCSPEETTGLPLCALLSVTGSHESQRKNSVFTKSSCSVCAVDG